MKLVNVSIAGSLTLSVCFFSQMNLLRQLQKTHTTSSVGNYRPVQPLFNRTVRASFQAADRTNSSSTTINTTTSTTGTTTITPPKGTQSPTSSTGMVSKGAEKSSSASSTATTGGEESPPAPTVEFDLGSSADRITAGLSMLFAMTVLFAVQH